MDNRPEALIPATPELAAGMAERLCPEHRREILDVSGIEASAAVLLSLAASREAYAFAPSGADGAVFMMGVEEKSPITGSAFLWMLGTEAMRRRPAALLRAARWGLRRAFLVTGADRLEQFIPGWYRTGLRFAVRLGFSLSRDDGRLCDRRLWNVVLHRGGRRFQRG